MCGGKGLAVTAIQLADQTIRDGIGSLWGQRVRSDMVVPVAGLVCRTGYSVVDMPLTAVRFPVFARYLRADPWEEADRIMSAFSGVKRRIPLRPNSVQFGLAPDSVVDLWIERICAHGMTSFWVQDVMYDIEKMARVVPVIKEHGAEAMMSVMYGLSPYHTDDFFGEMARHLASIPGVDGIYVEDTAGVLTPERIRTLIPAIQAATAGLPLELHMHNTTGLAPLCYLEAAKLGVGTLHTAISTLANGASLPSTEQTIRNLERIGYEVEVDASLLAPVADHFRRVAEAEGYPVGQATEYDTAVYIHQLPGGMMGTLERQLGELGMGASTEALLNEIGRVREDLGYPIMATPISQLVGTQAVMNVAAGARYAHVPDEVIHYVLGHYGEPAGPIDEEVRDRVLSGSRAREFAGWLQPQPSREKLRAKVAPGGSDDELMLRLLVSAADLAILEAAQRSPAPYGGKGPGRDVLAQLLERATLREFHVSGGGYSLSCSRRQG